MWEKEKLLVPSNFSFSHNVFNTHISLVRQNAALCDDGLRLLRVEYICWQNLEKTRKFVCERLENKKTSWEKEEMLVTMNISVGKAVNNGIFKSQFSI